MDTAAQNQITEKLKQKLAQSSLPQDVLEKLEDDLTRIGLYIKNNRYGPDIDKEVSFIDFVAGLPWEQKSQDILDLNRAKQIFDKNHYGLGVIKERILEYLSILILNQKKGQPSHQPILGFVGLVGSGKTSLAYSIAESLGRKIVRIPFGGLGSALQLRGQSRTNSEAEPGLIMKALRRMGVKNPVILLDELDRVTEEARADVMGVLVELLDPEQNMAFTDHYVGFPFDLSQVLFIATANNTGNIATAVLDRIELLEMPFYKDEEKIIIAKNYLLPKALQDSGVDPKLVNVSEDVWPQIVRPLGFDGGIRSLRRNIEALVRKVAMEVVEKGERNFQITMDNLREYMPV